jgi:uncharacterized protein (DUF3084 family)
MTEVTLETLANEIRSMRDEQAQIRGELSHIREELTAVRREQVQIREELSEMGGGVTLSFLAEQQRRLIEEARETKDDLRVAAAMVQRLDGTASGLVNEVRAEHARYARPDKRLKAVEGQPVD